MGPQLLQLFLNTTIDRAARFIGLSILNHLVGYPLQGLPLSHYRSLIIYVPDVSTLVLCQHIVHKRGPYFTYCNGHGCIIYIQIRETSKAMVREGVRHNDVQVKHVTGNQPKNKKRTSKCRKGPKNILLILIINTIEFFHLKFDNKIIVTQALFCRVKRFISGYSRSVITTSLNQAT